MGAVAALLLVLAAIGGWFFYRTQLNRGLVEAVAARNLEGARALLNRGADPNTRADKLNAYAPVALIAADQGSLELVRLLLDRGAKVDATVEGGDTALIQAAGNGHVAVVELLLQRGAAVNATDSAGVTPLINAAHRCHPQVLRLLLRHGADPSAVCKLGNAAHLAELSQKLHGMDAPCSETLTLLSKAASRK